MQKRPNYLSTPIISKLEERDRLKHWDIISLSKVLIIPNSKLMLSLVRKILFLIICLFANRVLSADDAVGYILENIILKQNIHKQKKVDLVIPNKLPTEFKLAPPTTEKETSKRKLAIERFKYLYTFGQIMIQKNFNPPTDAHAQRNEFFKKIKGIRATFLDGREEIKGLENKKILKNQKVKINTLTKINKKAPNHLEKKLRALGSEKRSIGKVAKRSIASESISQEKIEKRLLELKDRLQSELQLKEDDNLAVKEKVQLDKTKAPVINPKFGGDGLKKKTRKKLLEQMYQDYLKN